MPRTHFERINSRTLTTMAIETVSTMMTALITDFLGAGGGPSGTAHAAFSLLLETLEERSMAGSNFITSPSLSFR